MPGPGVSVCKELLCFKILVRYYVYFECPLLRVVGGERKMSSHIAWVVVLALRSLDFICAITNKENTIVKFSDF